MWPSTAVSMVGYLLTEPMIAEGLGGARPVGRVQAVRVLSPGGFL